MKAPYCHVGQRGSRQAPTMCQPAQLDTGSKAQSERPPRLRARASGAGSTGSRQPCSMARNSSLQHEFEERTSELIEATKAAVLHGEEQLAANKGGGHGAMLQRLSNTHNAEPLLLCRQCGTACFQGPRLQHRSPQLLDNRLIRQRLPQRVHRAAEGSVGKQALRAKQQAERQLSGRGKKQRGCGRS